MGLDHIQNEDFKISDKCGAEFVMGLPFFLQRLGNSRCLCCYSGDLIKLMLHLKYTFCLIAYGKFLLFKIASDATRYLSLSLAEQRQRQEVGHQELTAQEPNHPRCRYDGAFGNFYDYCNSKTDL